LTGRRRLFRWAPVIDRWVSARGSAGIHV